MTTNSPLRMRRNCNLELRLSPTTVAATDPRSAAVSAADDGRPQSQTLTIFYNGRMCVAEVTELQARAILNLATRELEETVSNEPMSPILQQSPVPRTPTTPGLSMKKSLQRFLQKRKHRVQATSPYNL